MQAIATLLQNDPYLKMAAADRLAARRDRRERISSRGIPEIVALSAEPIILPEPKPASLIVYRMWFDDLIAFSQSLKRRARIEDIQQECALFYGVSRADILSPCRTDDFVHPRQVACYLVKTMTNRTLPDIGRRFGGRDHTTVLHAFRKIERLLKFDKKLKADIDAIKASLAERFA